MKTSKRTHAHTPRTSDLINRTDWKISPPLAPSSPGAGSRAVARGGPSGSLTTSRRPFMQSRYYAPAAGAAAVAAAASHCPIHPILCSVERTMDQSKKEEGKRRWQRICVRLADNGRSRCRRSEFFSRLFIPFSLHAVLALHSDLVERRIQFRNEGYVVFLYFFIHKQR